MTSDDYYKILGLEQGASMEEVKRAYRARARMYHPDLNKRPEAADIFIAVNEAYEYVTRHLTMDQQEDDSHGRLTEEWAKYRRERARERAYRNSRENFREFTRSDIFRTSMVLNKTQLIISIIVSVFIICMAVMGYIIKLGMVDEGYDPPTLSGFIFLLSIGVLYFMVSLAHIMAFIQKKKRIDEFQKEN